MPGRGDYNNNEEKYNEGKFNDNNNNTSSRNNINNNNREEDETNIADNQSWIEIDFDDLELEDRIGGGGAGIVYQGWYKRSTSVAIKTLFDPRVDEKLKKEFMDELYVMSKLDHPNIVKFYGACFEPSKLCFVMELCEESLFDALHINFTHFTLEENLKICLGTAKAMEYLHSLKPVIIHRDLKSHNLLIDEHSNVKLCDFGLVRTRSTMAGTPNYMAPELLENKSFNQSVDVYAFGVILWEIFEKAIPYHGYEWEDIKRKICNDERPSLPSSLDCPQMIRELISTCWATESNERPTFKRIVQVIEDVMYSQPMKSNIELMDDFGFEDELDGLLRK